MLSKKLIVNKNNKKLIDKIKMVIVMFMIRDEVCSRQSEQKDEADKVQEKETLLSY